MSRCKLNMKHSAMVDNIINACSPSSPKFISSRLRKYHPVSPCSGDFEDKKQSKEPIRQTTERAITADQWLEDASKAKAKGKKPKKLEVIDLATLSTDFLMPGRARCTCQGSSVHQALLSEYSFCA